MKVKFFMINLDKKYTDYILSKTDIFKHIHPNILSVLGLVTDFLLLYFMTIGAVFLIGIALFIRYSCDCLDGAVARKYKKVSDLGGALDTFADNTLIFILLYGILMALGVSIGYVIMIPTAIVIANLIYMYSKNAILHHQHLTNYQSNLFDRIYLFGINNNCLIYLFTFIIIATILL
jgi:phosphatidylglycerophosphate synthase